MSEKNKKPQLFVEQTTYSRHGYDFTALRIRSGEARSLDSLIEGCVDNKVGYYDGPGYKGIETAARMQRHYEWLREQGYRDTAYCTLDPFRIDIELEWQHYKPDSAAREAGAKDGYCGEMHITLPPRHYELRPSYDMLARLIAAGSRKVGYYKFAGDPRHMLEVLKRRKAIHVERVTIPHSVHGNSWDESEVCVVRSTAALQVAS